MWHGSPSFSNAHTHTHTHTHLDRLWLDGLHGILHGLHGLLQHNSTLTTKVKVPCKKCTVPIDYAVDAHGVALRSYCSSCFNEVREARRKADKANILAGKQTIDRTDRRIKPKTPLGQGAAKTTSPGPKAATASTFSGENVNLALSASQHYLQHFNSEPGHHPESEDDEFNSLSY